MKPLNTLNNHERGQLLFDLFPLHRSPIIDFILGGFKDLKDNKDLRRSEWENNPLITFDYWFALGRNLDIAISNNSKTITKKKNVFCDQLFNGMFSLFSTSAIIEYSKGQNDKQFKLFVELMYET